MADGTFSSTPFVCFPTTLEAVAFFDKNIPSGRENDSLSLLQFLNSTANTEGVDRISDYISGVAGKKRGVRIRTAGTACFSICANEFDCLETKQPLSMPINVFELEVSTRYTICDGNGDPAELLIDSADYKQYCDTDDKAFFEQRVMDFDYRFLKEVDKTLTQLLLAQVTNAPQTYPIIIQNQLTGQRSINDELLLWLHELVGDAKMNLGDYVIFGGQLVNMIKVKLGITTLSTEGAEFVVNGFPAMYYNRNFDTTFGKNSLVLIPKKVFQLVQWLQYTGGVTPASTFPHI